MTSKEDLIKDKLTELGTKLGRPDIILIVYNPYKEEGIQKKDADYLMYLFENVTFSAPLIVLSGHGGDWKTGVLFPYIIKKKVNSYKVCVPYTCSSALCYTLFKAEELWTGEKTKLTQIDPIFEHEGEWRRAIKNIRSIDPSLKEKARKTFDLAQKHVNELSKPPSVFRYKNMYPDEFQHREIIIESFMNKDDHMEELIQKDLVDLEVKMKEMEEDADKIAKEVVELCQDFTIEKDVRVVFASSKEIPAEGEEGYYLAPLN